MDTSIITIESFPDHVDKKTIDSVRASTDVFLFSGDIETGAERFVCNHIIGKKQNDNLCLILTTSGGSADTAYSIARKLNRGYKHFSILVNGYCKSAGTLLALGANELIVTADAEFGPLDVQLFSPDEFLKRSSGLTITQAVKWVNEQAFDAFEQMFLDIRSKSGGNITTKTAGDFASALAGKLYANITDKIDPITVGEMQRAIDIAIEYGRRLGIPPELVTHLAKGYPSHGFVIDAEEALSLFPNARVMSDVECAVLIQLCSILYNEYGDNCTIQPHKDGLLAHIVIPTEVDDEPEQGTQVHDKEEEDIRCEESGSGDAAPPDGEIHD